MEESSAVSVGEKSWRPESAGRCRPPQGSRNAGLIGGKVVGSRTPLQAHLDPLALPLQVLGRQRKRPGPTGAVWPPGPSKKVDPSAPHRLSTSSDTGPTACLVRPSELPHSRVPTSERLYSLSARAIDMISTEAGVESARLALLAGVLGLISFLTYVAYSYLFHPLAAVPGPLRAQTGVGGWMTVRAAKRDLGWELARLHDRYGPFVRTGRNSVSVVDPAAVSDLYRFNGQIRDKSRAYEFFVRGRSSLCPGPD